MKLITAITTTFLPSALGFGVWNTIGNHINSRPDVSSLWGGNPENLGMTPIDYHDDHPFHPHNRELQEEFGFVPSQVEYAPNATSAPIRIKFITEPLESLRGQDAATDAKINAIINDVLPQVRQTWANHLNVFPASGSIPVNQEEVCFGAFNGLIPSELEMNGVEDADLVVLVSGKDVLTSPEGSLPVCVGTTLAIALPCQLDQFDRPVIGLMNICLPNMPDDDDDTSSSPAEEKTVGELLIPAPQVAETVLTAIHEVGHILGVGAFLYALFRSPTGEPLTPRPFQPREVLCVDGTAQNIVFPSENTLQLGEKTNGGIYYDIVTPRVQQVIRNHYNCQSLYGARLENQPTSPSCSGNHFDERTLYNELMTPIITGGLNILSPVTLALLEDSGWYQVNYEGAEYSSFGFGSGCDFVEKDCIIDGKVPDYARGDFCDSVSIYNAALGAIPTGGNDILCDPSHTAFAICGLLDREQVPPGELFIADSIRYFPQHPTWEGLQPQFDGCPIPSVALTNDCRDPSTAAIFYENESFGSGSRCINVLPGDGGNARAGCFSIECNVQTEKVVVAGHECQSDFEEFSILDALGQAATATCPKLSTVCPQFFCQGGCSGRGVCNFDTNQCECGDPDNTSPICAETSSAPSPGATSTGGPTALTDSSGLVSTLSSLVGLLAMMTSFLSLM